MSIADEFYVHLFPDNTPVNIANPADDLTVEQVASIFLGDVTKWNEIVK